MSTPWRGAVLAFALLVATSWPGQTVQKIAPVAAQPAASGRVIGATRGQVAWLDLLAPRPTPLTQLVRPAYPADVAATANAPFAVASIVSSLPGSSTSGGSSGMGGDLLLIDLASGTQKTLLTRTSDQESLDLPAIWADGQAILYQRSNLRAAVPMPGQATPQFQSRVEQIAPDGTGASVLLDDARYPGPAPDGVHLAFVRSAAGGAGIYAHSLADGSDETLVAPGQFLALAYPRYSPDGSQVAFAAISLLAPIGRDQDQGSWFGVRPAAAHGFPWEAWVVNADGSSMHQIEDVLDDDPSVAWSPDGTQLLIYGGWGSYLVDSASGTSSSLPYLTGYGSIGWLPE